MTAAEYNAREMAAGRLSRHHLLALGVIGGVDGALESAVSAFQAAHGLVPDGKAGPLTRQAIERELLPRRVIPVAQWHGRDAVISSPFGDARADGPHRGADWMFLLLPGELSPGSPVYRDSRKRRWAWPSSALAAEAGEVIAVSRLANGVWVKVRHVDGWRTQYGHLGEIVVAPGDALAMGALIGYPAPRAKMWPQHLHFGLQAPDGPAYRDPAPWLRAGGARV